jgi:ABC-type bacteriocin/lantibiotic exporter with double-glycine peptidase domain
MMMPFDIPTRIFPSLFQQVYTDNIITHKNPEWFAPLMVFYVALFVIELAIWTSFSVIRRKSYARIIITLSTKYIWTVFRLPLSLLAQFTAGELVARYASISKTVKSLDSAMLHQRYTVVVNP